MNLKKLTSISLFLALGFILHQIVPPIVLGIKPDFLLSMMFIAIVICEDYKSTVACSLAFGILAAITTGFPGGQLPNIIDKIVAANLIFLLNKALFKLNVNLKMVLISFVGTIVSGSVFLLSVALLFSLPASFSALFLTIVLPTAFANSFVAFLIFNIVLIKKLIRITSNE